MRAAAPPPARALELYAHVLGAEHIWLARLRQEPATAPVWPALDLEGCRQLAAANHSGLDRYLAGLDESGLGSEIPYHNSAGTAFRSSVRDILMHIALHGAYHRGQVALLLRDAGAAPEPTDYIAFVRGAPAATRRP